MPAVVWAEIGSPSRGMAQVGSASALGAEGRRFKSGYPDRPIRKGPRTMAGALLYAAPGRAVPGAYVPGAGVPGRGGSRRGRAGSGSGQPWPFARNATHASLIRSAWPLVNMSMQESCE